MKLISINVYGGYLFNQLMQFVEQQSSSTDVFCFQEMVSTSTNLTTSNNIRANLLQELQQKLPNFQSCFIVTHPNHNFKDTVKDVHVGMATLVNNRYHIRHDDEVIIHHPLKEFSHNIHAQLPSKMLYTEIAASNSKLNILNVHGYALPSDKLDSEERINQSHRILDYANKHTGPTIIIGDFNLMPSTQSIKVLTDNGYRNLITDNHISSTRGSMHKKIHPEYGSGKVGWQEFADYAFVSPEITVKHFEVPDVPISDHLPLIMEFEITP